MALYGRGSFNVNTHVFPTFKYILPPNKVDSRGTLSKLKTAKAYLLMLLVDQAKSSGPRSQKHVRNRGNRRLRKIKSKLCKEEEN